MRIRHTPRTRSPARESDPVLRLRRPPCTRHTRGERSASALARNRTWSTTFGGLYANPAHSKGCSFVMVSGFGERSAAIRKAFLNRAPYISLVAVQVNVPRTARAQFAANPHGQMRAL